MSSMNILSVYSGLTVHRVVKVDMTRRETGKKFFYTDVT